MVDHASGALPARMVATLGDGELRRVRIGVMFVTGLTGAVVGVAKLGTMADDATAWDWANAFAFLGTAGFCLIAVALTRTRWQGAAEVSALVGAYVGTTSVVVTASPDFAVVLAVAAYSLIIALPGVAFRIRSPHASLINTVAVCTTYVTSLLLRAALREDSGLENVEDAVLKLMLPPIAFATQWFMVHALNRRTLEALAESEHSRRAVRRALDHQVALNEAQRRFVPQEFITSLGHEDISEVQLSDSVTKTMSILFADILGYTKLVEGMTPDATVHLLNDLLGALEPTIHEHHGFVDSYIGDAIMALFDGSPRNAIDAALAMLAALRSHNEVRRAAGKPAIAIGIGINTGLVTLGTIGGAKRFKCSVFGDSVNLAARVEQLTRRYHTPLLVSEHTLELLGDGYTYDVRLIDKVRVVGRVNTTTLFEIYDADPEPLRSNKRQIDADYRSGIAAYYERRFAEAGITFARCQEYHDDSVLQAYAKRAQALADSPPDAAWTGIEVLHQK